MIFIAQAICTAKHHVFKHVRESLPLRVFILGSDVVPEMNRDNGTGKVLQGDDSEAVFKNFLTVVKFLGVLCSNGPDAEESDEHCHEDWTVHSIALLRKIDQFDLSTLGESTRSKVGLVAANVTELRIGRVVS